MTGRWPVGVLTRVELTDGFGDDFVGVGDRMADRVAAVVGAATVVAATLVAATVVAAGVDAAGEFAGVAEVLTALERAVADGADEPVQADVALTVHKASATPASERCRRRSDRRRRIRSG
jgi:hypothetical protein